MPGWLEKLRKIIDGEEDTSIKKTDNPREKYESADFLIKTVREVKKVIKRHFIPSSETREAYCPRNYVIFLNSDDEKVWLGEKLEIMKSFLSEEILKKINELDEHLNIQSVKVEIRVDGTLSKGQVEVQPILSDEKEKATSTKEEAIITSSKTSSKRKSISNAPTVRDELAPPKVLYYLEISENGEKLKVIPVSNKEIYIGRGTNVDVKLQTENTKIGRIHASLLYEDESVYVSSMNDNPTFVGERALNKGERLKISESDTIGIYEYTLQCKFN
jgi:hypothetical protein